MPICFQSLNLASMAAVALLSVFILGSASDALAQSATRGRPVPMQRTQVPRAQTQSFPAQRTYVQPAQTGSTTRSSISNQTGSTTRSATARPVGLQGYCPVCIIEMKKWMRGNPAFQAVHDGKTSYFPGEEQRQLFLKNPEKYTPALGGDCTVCLTEMGKRMPGTVHFAALNNNRLFLFPGQKQKQMFIDNPSKYLQADVALEGNCPVCRVEMGKDVPGNPSVSLTHGGLKSLFPADEQRKMFLANPTKYAVQADSPPIPASK